MEIASFFWLEAIIDKLWYKHRVTISEVEEVFFNQPHIRFVEKGHKEGENLYTALGRSDAGRLLIIFFVHKQNRQALVVSARNMTDKERKLYERH